MRSIIWKDGRVEEWKFMWNVRMECPFLASVVFGQHRTSYLNCVLFRGVGSPRWVSYVLAV